MESESRPANRLAATSCVTGPELPVTHIGRQARVSLTQGNTLRQGSDIRCTSDRPVGSIHCRLHSAAPGVRPDNPESGLTHGVVGGRDVRTGIRKCLTNLRFAHTNVAGFGLQLLVQGGLRIFTASTGSTTPVSRRSHHGHWIGYTALSDLQAALSRRFTNAPQPVFNRFQPVR